MLQFKKKISPPPPPSGNISYISPFFNYYGPIRPRQQLKREGQTDPPPMLQRDQHPPCLKGLTHFFQCGPKKCCSNIYLRPFLLSFLELNIFDLKLFDICSDNMCPGEICPSTLNTEINDMVFNPFLFRETFENCGMFHLTKGRGVLC